LPAPVPPEIRMLILARTAAARTSSMSREMLLFSSILSAVSGLVPNRRIETAGPSSASGGMMAFTRDPSGSRASTIGDDSSTRRPTAPTIRSMICNRCRSSRNLTSTFCSTPKRSIYTTSLPFTRMSEMVGSLSSTSSGPKPNTSSSSSAWSRSFSAEFSSILPLPTISRIRAATACLALPLLAAESFSRSNCVSRVR
jgi:hypothetical protein